MIIVETSLTINSRSKRIVENGIEYIVVPMTMIVPGVLNGSEGPIYYPAVEVSLSTSLWQDIPIVIYHPNVNGKYVSAQHPGVIESSGVGFLRNPRTNNKGNLVADGWIDVKRISDIYPSVLARIESNKKVELSTGLSITKNLLSQVHRDLKGREYQVEATNLIPDHLAILPDQKGACSISDGCGVLVNRQFVEFHPFTSHSFLEPLPYLENKMKLNAQQREAIVNELVTNCDCWKHQGDSEVLNGFSDEKLITLFKALEKSQQAEAVVNAAVKGFADATGIAYRLNPDSVKWEKSDAPTNNASNNVNKQTANSQNTKMSSEDLKKSLKDIGSTQKVQTVYTSEQTTPATTPTINHGGNIQLNGHVKDDQIVTVNLRKVKTLDDLIKIAAPAHLKSEFENTLNQYNQLIIKEKDSIINKLLVNVSDHNDRQVQREYLLKRTVEELQLDLARMPKQIPSEEISQVMPKRSSRKVVNQDADMLIAPTINWSEVGDKTVNRQPLSEQVEMVDNASYEDDDKIIQGLPHHLRVQYQDAVSLLFRERNKIISELTANLDEESENKLRTRLSNKSIEELKDYYTAFASKKETPKPNYFAAGTTTVNRIENLQDDILIPPTMNWKEV